jgi:hypothetical protein
MGDVVYCEECASKQGQVEIPRDHAVVGLILSAWAGTAFGIRLPQVMRKSNTSHEVFNFYPIILFYFLEV